MSVVIETTLGDVTVDLFLNERPKACVNFLKLCKLKYYNYNLFHTISRGFIAQTGDPTGSRTGGESIFGILNGPDRKYFQGENKPRIKHTKMGLISFVGNEDFMLGSQFFITLGEDLTYLDEKHCVFGEVVEGFDTLEIINEVICDGDDRPYQDVRITHTVILDDPFPDPEALTVPSRSPSPSAERLMGGRIAPDEEIDEMEGKSAAEIAELQADREAKARATILEMVGDIPDAEMAPPENVLFVCKLNPVTTDDDLEIIFNRFGKIKSCEVIRDRKTGDSLQYAFIEFEDRKSCEDAYFKMDNILIDDRRIHVDFSQSVSKIKWHGKGRGVTHYDEKGKKIENGNDKEKNKSYNKLSKKIEDRDMTSKHYEKSNKERNGNKEYNSQYKKDELFSSKNKTDYIKKTSKRGSRSPSRDKNRHNSRERIKYEKESRRSPIRDNKKYNNRNKSFFENDSQRSPFRNSKGSNRERDIRYERKSGRNSDRYNDRERYGTYENKRKYESDSRRSPVRDNTRHRSGDKNKTYNDKTLQVKDSKKSPVRVNSRVKNEERKTSEVSSSRRKQEYGTSRSSEGHYSEKKSRKRSGNFVENEDKKSKKEQKQYSSESSDDYKERKISKKDTEIKKDKKNDEQYRTKSKSSTKKKKKKKPKSESSSETRDDKHKRKKKKFKHSKKKVSSSDTSSEDDTKNRKKKKKRKVESSDSSSSSTTSSSSSESESSEDDRKKRKKKENTKRTTNKRKSSDSSESEVERKRKKT